MNRKGTCATGQGVHACKFILFGATWIGGWAAASEEYSFNLGVRQPREPSETVVWALLIWVLHIVSLLALPRLVSGLFSV